MKKDLGAVHGFVRICGVAVNDRKFKCTAETAGVWVRNFYVVEARPEKIMRFEFA